MPVNISRSIGYYRGKPGQNWLAEDLQKLQDFVNRLEAKQASSAPASAARTPATTVKTTVAPATVPVVVSSSDFHLHKTANSGSSQYLLKLGNTGKPVINFSDMLHSGQIITPRYLPTSVITEVIAPGAVTNSQQAVGSYSTLPGGSTTLLTLNVSTGGLPVLIFGKANFTGATADVNNNFYSLYSSSGGYLDESGTNGWGIRAGAFEQIFFLGYESAPSDPVTYTFTVNMTGSGVEVDHSLMTVLNAKR